VTNEEILALLIHASFVQIPVVERLALGLFQGSFEARIKRKTAHRLA
jgi:hypothetical protein